METPPQNATLQINKDVLDRLAVQLGQAQVRIALLESELRAKIQELETLRSKDSSSDD